MSAEQLPVGVSKSSLAVIQCSKSPPGGILVTYIFFAFGAWCIFHFVAGQEFSAILTIAVLMQCLAVSLLAVQVVISHSANGISGRAIGLEAFSLVNRLASTLWLNGYLPMDASGDYIFQCVDILTLSILLWIFFAVFHLRTNSQQQGQDCFPVIPLIVLSYGLAAAFHGNNNARPVFDVLWMAGLFLGIFAVLPQLWLISSTDGQVNALTSHYIAAMAFGRCLSGVFMWYAKEDILSDPWIEGINHAPLAILVAHAVHMVFLADFAYYYIQGVIRDGFAALQFVDVCNDV